MPDSAPFPDLAVCRHAQPRSPVGRFRLSLNLGWAEPLLVAIAAPLLLFPKGQLAWLGLAILTAGWLIGTLRSPVALAQCRINRPIIVLLLMTLLSLYLSVDPGLSLPKFYGMLLGFGVFYATVRTIQTRRQIELAGYVLAAAIAAIAFVGLVGTDWNTGKFPFLEAIQGAFPRLITSIPTSFGSRPGIHPNELGGTLAFLLPVPLALLLSGQSRKASVLLVVLSALALVVLVVSASRSGLAAALVSLLLLLIWRWRRVGLGLVASAVVVALVSLLIDAGIWKSTIALLASDPLVQSRVDLWQRSLQLIQDFPFTGIGLNTFPIVLDALYPSFAGTAEYLVAHAHDIFLQTAVDFGLAGLAALLALGGFAATGYWRALAAQRRRTFGGKPPAGEAALVGLCLGVLSYLVFGLTDSITLGAKPTILLWLMLGLVVAHQRTVAESAALPGAREGSAQSGESDRSKPPRFSQPWQWVAASYWLVVYALVGVAYLVAALATLNI